MGYADNPSLGATSLFITMTVQAGPTPGLMPAGFDRDDIGGDRSNGECCSDPRNDVLGCHRLVQEKNIDQGAGSAGIPVGLAGRGPKRFVGGGEGPGCSCVGQSSRTWQGAGFVVEDLEVMI